MKHETVSAENEGMAGIGSALEAGYHLIGWSEHVNDFAFSLISPLESENYV